MPDPAAGLLAFAPADALLFDLLAVSLTGVIYYTPVTDAAGTVLDFRFEHLNPAAQRMMRLPPHPTLTHRQQWPHSEAHGTFAFHVDAYLTGEPHEFDVNYPADGYDHYYRLAARRSGVGLLVGFTDTADQEDRSVVEVALRASQAQEREARNEAERQRNELRSFVEQAPVAVAVYRGPDHRVELANAATLAIWGRTLPEVLDRPVFEVLPEAAVPEVVAHFDRVYATGQAHTVHEQVTLLNRHGQLEEVYWNFVFQPEVQADGRVSGIRSVGTDVTAQVRARQQVQRFNEALEARVQERTQALEAALRLAEQHRAELLGQQALLGQILGQVPAAIATLRGPEHRYSFFNEGYQALAGRRARLGLTVAEALPELVPQGFVGLLDQVYATGVAFRGQDTPAQLYDPATGRPAQRYVDFIYQPLLDAQGATQGILAFIVDVTDKVQTRQQHAVQQRQLKEVFEQAPVALFVVRGPEYVFDIVNPGMGAMIGFAPDYMLGRRYFDLLPGLAAQGYRDLLDHVYQTGQPHVALEQAAQLPHHGDGETGYYSFTYAPLRDADDRVSDIMCIAVDVTEQVRARQQLEHLNQQLAARTHALTEANQQLTRTNADLDTFVYMASHDLKAPITNIESIALALRAQLPASALQDEVVAHLLDLLAQTVTRFRFTIDQLTDLTKLQLAHAGPAEAVDLAAVIKGVRLDLAPALTAADTELTIEVAPALRVRFSAANLRSVVYNLLSNAVKYRHPDRACRVQVRAAVTAQGVVLEVQDNGLGMSAAQQRQLFGLFQRLHTHVEGTGVGLYITKRLVENAGGSIAVQSQPEVGTTFTVTFSA